MKKMDDVVGAVVGIVFAVVFLGIVAGSVFGVGKLVYSGVLAYERNRCEGFGESTGRDTEFVHISWGNWQCLAESSDGRRIPIDRLREVVD